MIFAHFEKLGTRFLLIQINNITDLSGTIIISFFFFYFNIPLFIKKEPKNGIMWKAKEVNDQHKNNK